MTIFDRIASLKRYKTVDDEFLEHSEWIRKLRIPSILGIASILTVPCGVFIIIPHVVINVSGPSALLSLLVAFVVTALSGLHMNELMCSMPKSCLLYNFTYVNFGELAAFLVGWISMLDFIICIAIVAKSWSSHMNLLFRGLFSEYFTAEIPYQLGSAFDTRINFCAVLAIFFASVILCCSIRVLATVSIIMVTMCTLATNSTIFVGLYFADPDNWLAAGFFKDGTSGVINGASNFLCAYIGVEALSFLLEETKNPRKRLPFIVPLIIFAFTLILFLTTMIFTLTSNVSKYPTDMLLPNIFDKINIPSAKYVMAVGSVCGLSGAMLAIFVPATRLLSSMCADRLLPLSLLAHTSKKRGVPYYAVFLCALIASLITVLKTSKMFEIIAFSTPLRLTLLGCLVYDQRYRPDNQGLFRETAPYRGVHHKRYKAQSAASITDDKDSSSATVSRWSMDDEDSELMSSYEALRGFLAQQEDARLQRRLEKLPSINEESGLLSPAQDEAISQKFLARKPLCGSRYSTFKHSHSLSENMRGTMAKFSKERKQLSLSFEATNFGHSCIRSPCSPVTTSPTSFDLKKNKLHLFERDIPELPYYNKYSSSVRSSEDFNRSDHEHPMKILALFILISIAVGFLALKTECGLTKLYSLLPALVALVALGCIVIDASRQRVNPKNSERRCKTSAFPYLTLLTIFLCTLVACTATFITIVKFIIWIIIGMVLYTLYGYRHSKEGHESLGGPVVTNSIVKDNSCIGIMSNYYNDVITGSQNSSAHML